MFGCGEGINAPPPDRKYKLTTAEIVIPNKPVTKILYDFQIIAGLAKELPADSQRGCDALFYANKICNTFMPNDPSSWTRCHAIAQEFFETTRNGDNPQHEVTAIGHCHIDTAWLWEYQETQRKCARSWSSQCNLMDRYPHYKFACSQAQQYQWVKQLYPTLYQRIIDKVKTGQFIPIGGVSFIFPQTLTLSIHSTCPSRN
jgi:alpha-mannosidase